jgi:hypothetical protein
MLWEKLGWSDLSIPYQNLCVRYCNTLTTSCCVCKQRSKNHKKIIQTIMASTRSSDYAAIGSGSDGLGGGSQLSRQLARGPPPGGKEEEDINSTPVAYDDDDNGGGEVEVNGECEGDGNSNGPVDNNVNKDWDIDNDDDDDNNNGGGARQKRKRGMIVEEQEEMEVEEE